LEIFLLQSSDNAMRGRNAHRATPEAPTHLPLEHRQNIQEAAVDRSGLKKGRAALSPLLGRVDPDPDPSSMAVRGTKFKLSPMPIDVQRRIARMADVESRSKEAQGAGLYVEGEIPNRVLHPV
jgi:hypothetical protein